MAERRMKRHGEHYEGEPGSDNTAPALWVTPRDSEGAHAASRFVQVRVARTAGRATIANAYAQHAS
jgi:hypothetical protein